MENNLFVSEDLKLVQPTFGAKVDIKLLNKDAQIPTYGTNGAAGFDFRSIDDYTGEIGIIVENIGDEDYIIHKGDRIAQGLILPYFKANFNLVDNLEETERGAGAFGSTGIK